MDEEYNNSKIETKAADSSSGGYVPSAESIPASEIPEQELYHAKSFLCAFLFVLSVFFSVWALRKTVRFFI